MTELTRKEQRVSILLDRDLPSERLMEGTLSITRAERVCLRAIGEHGRFQTAELLLPGESEPVLSYARLES